LAKSIEADDELFFTRKMFILVEKGHIFGPDLGKIKVYGVILVTRCHLVLAVFFGL